MIKNKMAKKALVGGAEVFPRTLDGNDRATAVLFGDGAGAAVLTAGSQPGVHASVLHADGSQVGILSVPGNVSGGRIVGSPFLQMHGREVFKRAGRGLEDSARAGGAGRGKRRGTTGGAIS